MKVQLKNAKPSAEIQLSDAAFGRVYNEALVHQVVTAYMAAGRAGTGVGTDVYPLRTSAASGFVSGASLTPSGKRHRRRARRWPATVRRSAKHFRSPMICSTSKAIRTRPSRRAARG